MSQILENEHNEEFAKRWKQTTETLNELRCSNPEHSKDEDGNERLASSMYGLSSTPTNHIIFGITGAVCCNEFAETLKSEAHKILSAP